MKSPIRKPLNLGLDLDRLADLQVALAKCAALGADEELCSVPQHATAAELLIWLGCRCRNGHKRPLRAAYEAGRFSAKMTLEA